MTPEEWERCDDPERMLQLLASGTTERKQRLLCCACVRRLWAWLPEHSQHAIEVAERFADGAVDAGQLDAANRTGAARRGR